MTSFARRGVGGRLLASVLLLALFLPAIVAGQSGAPLRQRKELVRLDALLAAGDSAAAEALLQALGPDLAKDDRLAFDTIYVLIGRDRFPEARAQWNRLAARLQNSLRPGPADPAQRGDPGAGTAVLQSPPEMTDERRRRLAEALFTQGLLTSRAGEKDEAVKLLQQADGYGFPPLDSPLMLLAADCLRDVREYDLAAGAYREFLKREPSNTAARLGLATSLYAARKFAAAQTELEGLLHLARQTPQANYTLGAVLLEQNRYDEARLHLERELKLDPRCTPCLSRLAHLAYLEGDDRQCESLLARARALDPADVEAHMVSGLLAFRTGRYPAAIDHLSRVVARSPAYSAAHYQLAMAYRRVGDAAKAREHFDAYQRLLKEQKAREIGFRGEK
jgi:tetratricopeptide (TPR) repeat protein